MVGSWFSRARVSVAAAGVFMALAATRPGFCPGGELTVEGNLVVKTNLVVEGQVILPPQGDLSMGSYTNRAAP